LGADVVAGAFLIAPRIVLVNEAIPATAKLTLAIVFLVEDALTEGLVVVTGLVTGTRTGGGVTVFDGLVVVVGLAVVGVAGCGGVTPVAICG
jgi:hypothetical protein